VNKRGIANSSMQGHDPSRWTPVSAKIRPKQKVR
jgi:hypothetical protein